MCVHQIVLMGGMILTLASSSVCRGCLGRPSQPQPDSTPRPSKRTQNSTKGVPLQQARRHLQMSISQLTRHAEAFPICMPSSYLVQVQGQCAARCSLLSAPRTTQQPIECVHGRLPAQGFQSRDDFDVEADIHFAIEKWALAPACAAYWEVPWKTHSVVKTHCVS